MRADWEILLPEGALRCRMLQGQTALPGQIGVLYACEPDPELEFPTQLHRWAQEQGLAASRASGRNGPPPRKAPAAAATPAR
jgi:hypothetical protein